MTRLRPPLRPPTTPAQNLKGSRPPNPSRIDAPASMELRSYLCHIVVIYVTLVVFRYFFNIESTLCILYLAERVHRDGTTVLCVSHCIMLKYFLQHRSTLCIMYSLCILYLGLNVYFIQTLFV